MSASRSRASSLTSSSSDDHRRRSSSVSWLDDDDVEDLDRGTFFGAAARTTVSAACVLDAIDVEEQRELLERIESQRSVSVSGSGSSSSHSGSPSPPPVIREYPSYAASEYHLEEERRERELELELRRQAASEASLARSVKLRPAPLMSSYRRCNSAPPASDVAAASFSDMMSESRRASSSSSCASSASSDDFSSPRQSEEEPSPPPPVYSDLVQEQQAIWEAIQRQQREEEEETERLRRHCDEEEKQAAALRMKEVEEETEELRKRYSEVALEEPDIHEEEEAIVVMPPHELSRMRGSSARQQELRHSSLSSSTSSSLSSSISSSVHSSSAVPTPRRMDVLHNNQGDSNSLYPLLTSAKSHELDGSFDQHCAATLLEVYAGQSIRLFDRRETILKSDVDEKKKVTCGGCARNFYVSRGCKILYCPECETLTPATGLPKNAKATAA